jgi:hypothetical protein
MEEEQMEEMKEEEEKEEKEEEVPIIGCFEPTQ